MDRCSTDSGRTFFAAFECFGVEGFLAFAMALRDFAREFAFVWEDGLFAERGRECVKLSARHVDKGVFFFPGRCVDGLWRRFRLVHSPYKRLCKRAIVVLRAGKGEDDKIVLALCFFRNGQAEHGVDIFTA